jgi:hypothetical protein
MTKVITYLALFGSFLIFGCAHKIDNDYVSGQCKKLCDKHDLEWTETLKVNKNDMQCICSGR